MNVILVKTNMADFNNLNVIVTFLDIVIPTPNVGIDINHAPIIPHPLASVRLSMPQISFLSYFTFSYLFTRITDRIYGKGGSPMVITHWCSDPLY